MKFIVRTVKERNIDYLKKEVLGYSGDKSNSYKDIFCICHILVTSS